MHIVTSVQPAASTSARAERSRSISLRNDAFTAKTIRSASTVSAAMIAPSMIRYGLRRTSIRSLNDPGSPSEALTTTDGRSPGASLSATAAHLLAVGNPAPPRPRSPDASISPMVPAGPSFRAASRPRPPPAER
jgi:hypothetical protein